ncbi:MAG: hypothetical protein HY064_09025 [Bacteroidetes bacterium]|nr:hypothetical protein [Bacteroidota bacterium]
MNSSPEKEAEVIGKYLLGGKMPNAQSIFLYTDAMKKKNIVAEGKDERLMNFMLDFRWTAGMIDSALAFGKRRSAVRKKIMVMSAILETQPEYAGLFLPKKRSWIYNIYIFWVGFRAVMKIIFGKILIAFI